MQDRRAKDKVKTVPDGKVSDRERGRLSNIGELQTKRKTIPAGKVSDREKNETGGGGRL